MKKSDRTEILLEDIQHQVKTIAEGQTSNSQRLDRIESVIFELVDLKSDVETIKTAVMDTSQMVKSIEKKVDGHEVRITRLEDKVFS